MISNETSLGYSFRVDGIILFSFNNGPAKEVTKTADTKASTAASRAEVKPAFIPFKIVAIQHRVKDFDKSVTDILVVIRF
jgi:hypothetical protein